VEGLNAVVAINSVAGFGFTVSGNPLEAVCCELPLSRTATVKVKLPEFVGVPDRTPVVGFMVTPLGAPETDHAYGGVPPVALINSAVYADPAVAVDGFSDAVVIERGAVWGFTVRLNPFDADCAGLPLSRTIIVGAKEPEVDGVPESMPLAASIARPPGAPVTVQL
jgi:hypothetical protein